MQENAYCIECTVKSRTHQEASKLFHILSHQARLRILDELRKDEACVCHLQAVLKRPQAYISQQLRVLREAGLVTDERDGMLVYYHLVDPEVERLLGDVLGPAGEPTRLATCSCPRCQG
jgi:DNA-binding transcriptional ArsR family regulator